MARGGRIGLGVAALLGCGPQVVVPEAETDTDGTMATTGAPSTSTTVMSDSTRGDDVGDDADDDVVDEGPIVDDFPPVDPGCGCGGTCIAPLDLLVVVDNSAGTGEEQAALARAMVGLVRDLEGLTDQEGNPAAADVQVMVTTTDVGNPLCTPFRPDGYDPAMGTPITDACVSRLQDFTSLDGLVSMPEVCTDVCSVGIVPDDPFVAFDTESDNVPDVDPVDVDGDGTPDSPAAQALACIVPQGLDGCGFESPLEAMLQALNPDAPWNQGPRPFLREDAALGIVLVTDEADCSVHDYAAMSDPAFQEIDPSTGQPSATSAICWNAGVECDGPDAQGLYSGCAAADGPLQPLSRYTSYLGDYLVGELNKGVFMVALLGVPPVTANNPTHPFEPVAGGEFDLIVRDWIDGEYPVGDILPAEWAMGIDAERKTFLYGIGPGCTGEDGDGGFLGQGIPNHRVMEVCHSLDTEEGGARCAIDSICAADYTAALGFVTGVISPVVQGPLIPCG